MFAILNMLDKLFKTIIAKKINFLFIIHIFFSKLQIKNYKKC